MIPHMFITNENIRSHTLEIKKVAIVAINRNARCSRYNNERSL